MKQNEAYTRPSIDTRDSKQILRAMGPASCGVDSVPGCDDNLPDCDIDDVP